MRTGKVRPALGKSFRLAQYRLLARVAPYRSTVLDAFCESGEGSRVLAQAGLRVFAVGPHPVVVDRARELYDHRLITWICGDLLDIEPFLQDEAIAFTAAVGILEYSLARRDLVKMFARVSPGLVAAVPSLGYIGKDFGGKAYTRRSLQQILRPFDIEEIYTQYEDSFPIPGETGRNLIAVARRNSNAPTDQDG